MPFHPDHRLLPRGRASCSSHLQCDLNGLRLPEFAAGCRTGVAALVIALVVGSWARRRGDSPLPVGGLLIAGAFVEAMRESGRLVPGLPLGLVLLAAAGLIADLLGQRLLVLAALAVPGAWALATHAGLGDVGWERVALAATVIVGAPLAADLDRRGAANGLGPVLLAVSAVGVYFTVGDTDVALALVPVVVLVAAAAWPVPLVRLGSGGAAASVGVLAWVTAVGGLGRESAVVGGLACVGLLAAEPAGRILARRRRGALAPTVRRVWTAVGAGVAQLAVVFIASRVAGTLTATRSAAVIAALDIVLATACCTWAAAALPAPERRRHRTHAHPRARR